MGRIADNSKIAKDFCTVSGLALTALRVAGVRSVPAVCAPFRSGYLGLYHIGWGGYWISHGLRPGKAGDVASGTNRAVGGLFITLDMVGKQMGWKWSSTYMFCSKWHAYLASIWAFGRSLRLATTTCAKVRAMDLHDPRRPTEVAYLWNADLRLIKKGIKALGLTLVRSGTCDGMPLTLKVIGGSVGTARVYWNRYGKYGYIKGHS